MVTKPKNDAEAAAYRTAAEEYERDRAQEAYDAKSAAFKPLVDLLASKPFATVRDSLRDLRATFADNPAIDPHLQPIPGFLDRLAAAVASETAAPPLLAMSAEPAPPAAGE